MRPSQKSKLKNELLKNVELTDMFLKENYFIIDGGWVNFYFSVVSNLEWNFPFFKSKDNIVLY